jgi:Anti-sigma-K factor rskA.
MTDIRNEPVEAIDLAEARDRELVQGISRRDEDAFRGLFRPLADPGPDKVYETWMLQGSTALSGGCVRPHDGSIVAFVHADLGDADRMAVTVEPGSCPSQPTSARILVSDPLVA